jgi:hypothetical protein
MKDLFVNELSKIATREVSSLKNVLEDLSEELDCRIEENSGTDKGIASENLKVKIDELNNTLSLDLFLDDKELIVRDSICDMASSLNKINFQIAELSRIKEELEARLNALLEHSDDCSKTYVVDKYKITITSGYNYTLNKDEYSIMKSQLPACFNPVKEKISYEIDKKVIRDAEKYGSSDDLNLLAQFISKKAKKLHVKVGAAV